MGGQAGDTGTINEIPVTGTQQIGKARALIISSSSISDLPSPIAPGDKLSCASTPPAAARSKRTTPPPTCWTGALDEAVPRTSSQQGSSVDEHRRHFDFNSAPQPRTNRGDGRMVNGVIKQDMAVSWTEVRTPPSGPQGHHAVLRSKDGDSPRRRDRREAQRARRLLDGTLRRHPRPQHLRDRPFQNKSESAIAAGSAASKPFARSRLAHLRENIEGGTTNSVSPATNSRPPTKS